VTLYRLQNGSLKQVTATSFPQEKLQERRDLQNLIKANISVLQDDLMLIAEEYGDWLDSRRRIDLLCLDRQANIVVVELKRNDTGEHMDLQAVRYAAMVSSMTFEQLAGAHARYLQGEDSRQRAEKAILDFLDWESAADGGLSPETVRIILVSGDFSKELTTAVLWLNKQGLDITCIRAKPYRVEDHLLVDLDQIIPLPEAADYETAIRAQQQESQRANTQRQDIFLRFWSQLIARSNGKTRLWENRNAIKDHWLGGASGRVGFAFQAVMRKDDCRVECYIDLGQEDQSLRAFKALFADRAAIETAFGGDLTWQDLPESRGCRICKNLLGGWRTSEADWPALQDAIIENMVRLETALRSRILALQI